MESPGDNSKGPRLLPVKIGLGLLVIYLFLGVIAYPWWWVALARTQDFSALWLEATGPYLWWNFAWFGIIAFFVWFSRAGHSNAPVPHARLAQFANSSRFSTLLIFITAVAAARVFFSIQQNSRREALDAFAQLRTTVESLDGAKLRPSALPKVVDLLYVNKGKIEEFYGQVSPRLTLKDKNVAKSRTDETGGSIGVEHILSAQSRGQDTAGASETYAEKPLTVSEQVVFILNELKSAGSLTQIKTLDLDNTKLADFDSSVNLLQTYRIDLRTDQLTSVRRQIVEDAVKIKAPSAFAPNTWVLIEGSFVLEKGATETTVSFDYLPSLPGRIGIFSSIPTAALEGCRLIPSRATYQYLGFCLEKSIRPTAKTALSSIS